LYKYVGQAAVTKATVTANSQAALHTRLSPYTHTLHTLMHFKRFSTRAAAKAKAETQHR